jgi:hypothetical protein
MQDTCKFTLLANELRPLHQTGSFVPVSYLPGHDNVLLPGAEDGFLRITYTAAMPKCLQNFAYSVILPTQRYRVFI